MRTRDDRAVLDTTLPRAALGSPALWSELARRVGLAPDAPVVLGLSGGSDSVYLLHALAEARPRPAIHAVHVEHGLRGDEGRADLVFCARTAQSLDVPFVARRVALDPRRASLEARARHARYAELCAECARIACPTLLTAHQQDDALETMILRWMRGTDLPGLAGLRPRTRLAPSGTVNPTEFAIDLVRPLLAFDRHEMQTALAERGLLWREDSTNATPRFSRNRVRNVVLPWIEAVGGASALQSLRALERHLAEFDAHCAALGPDATPFSRGDAPIPRAELAALAPALARRRVWRSVIRHTGIAPPRRALTEIESALCDGRDARANLRGGWTAVLSAAMFEIEPAIASSSLHRLPPAPAISLAVPGCVDLGDGRAIQAAWIARTPGDPVPRAPHTVVLDARDAGGSAEPTRDPITVRLPRPGDRFHALGAPGKKELTRFLRDAGIPRDARARVPLVLIAGEIAWVAGVRPSHARRVRSDSRACLSLTLAEVAGDSGGARG